VDKVFRKFMKGGKGTEGIHSKQLLSRTSAILILVLEIGFAESRSTIESSQMLAPFSIRNSETDISYEIMSRKIRCELRAAKRISRSVRATSI
jgi:hypothetical protein